MKEQVPPRPGHAPDENRRVTGLTDAGNPAVGPAAYVTFGCVCGDERCDWVGIAHLDNYRAPDPSGPVCYPAPTDQEAVKS